ncbi:MAG: (2Fe-2S)-binding protein [Deltaproteobacteria bacterium]|nr:(2Fe-2S)-binding protein [Deltaproteobacteria bacterium]
MKKVIELKVNGILHEVLVKPQQTLLEVLRDSLGLTGAKEGCGLGGCGACTVLLDGVPALSCLMLVEAAVGKEIVTIEGLAKEGVLDPLQESFVRHGAIQCGYCSPGMIMTGKALLDQNPKPSREEIRLAIAGNLCRCTGYQKIVDAIEAVASDV